MKRAAALLIVLAIVVLGAGALARSSLFSLRRLEVQGPGAAHVTRRVLALGKGTSLLLVSATALERRALAADPLAASAGVRVALPHTVLVTLAPRRAVALVEALAPSDPGSVEGLYGIDRTGRVLPATPQELRHLPLVTGVGPAPDRPFAVLSGEAANTGLRVVSVLPRSLLPDLSEVHVERGGATVELVLMDARPVLLGFPQHLREKLADLAVLLGRYPWPEYAGTGFDLRDAARPSLFTVGQS